MHVTRPKAKEEHHFWASNLRPNRKESWDADDMKVISSGQPIVGVSGEGKRLRCRASPYITRRARRSAR